VFEKLLVCLDGSSLADRIIPVALAIRRAAKSTVIFLRVVQDAAEIASEEEALRERARLYHAQLRIVVSQEVEPAIRAELAREPRAIAALTTHGRRAWSEALMGSVASQVLHGSQGPVLLFRPQKGREAPRSITTVAAALDGNPSAEMILPFAIRAAQALSGRLLLLQALPVNHDDQISIRELQPDVLESSYLERTAAAIQSRHGIEAQWDVLHGEPGDALCRYISDLPETLLAMTTHARSSAQKMLVGSVASYCVRHAGVPLLLYRPR
jgi:nucleotide-binding universal stress UspA family protein